MSNTKHTPGKWEVHKNIKHSHAIGTYDSGSFNPVAYLHTKQDDQEYEANAKLIAAAPEMLEALQTVITEIAPAFNFDPRQYPEWAKNIQSLLTRITP